MSYTEQDVQRVAKAIYTGSSGRDPDETNWLVHVPFADDGEEAREWYENQASAALEAMEREPLENVPVERQLSRGNMDMELFVGDYTEGSPSLAGDAIEGMLDYCRALGITHLVVNQDAPEYDWYGLTQEEKEAAWARREAISNAVAKEAGSD